MILRLHEWERELMKLEREMTALCAAAEPGLVRKKTREGRTIQGLRDSLSALQITISSLFEKMRKLSRMEIILLPREKTLIHFATILLEKLRRLDDVRSKYHTRLMWLQLIHTRLSGEEPGDHIQIQPDELIKLAVREADLEKTERLLAEALVKFRDEKRLLFRRYYSLEIHDENLKASRAMQTRFGKTWSEAAGSPPLVALNQFMNRLVMPIRSRRLHQQLRRLQSEYEVKTRAIMGGYQTVVIDRLNGETELGLPELEEFEMTLKQLNTLQRETREACERLFGSKLSTEKWQS